MFWVCVGCLSLFMGVFRGVFWVCLGGYKCVLSGYNHVLGMCGVFESVCGCV